VLQIDEEPIPAAALHNAADLGATREAQADTDRNLAILEPRASWVFQFGHFSLPRPFG